MNCDHCLEKAPHSQKHRAVLCVHKDNPVLLEEAKQSHPPNSNQSYGAKRQQFSAPTDQRESQQSRSSDNSSKQPQQYPKYDPKFNAPRGGGYSRRGGYEQRGANYRRSNLRGRGNTRGGGNPRGGGHPQSEGKPQGYNPGNRLQKHDLAAIQAYFLQATKELKDSIQPHLAAIVSTIKDKASEAEGNSTGAPH